VSAGATLESGDDEEAGIIAARRRLGMDEGPGSVSDVLERLAVVRLVCVLTV